MTSFQAPLIRGLIHIRGPVRGGPFPVFRGKRFIFPAFRSFFPGFPVSANPHCLLGFFRFSAAFKKEFSGFRSFSKLFSGFRSYLKFFLVFRDLKMAFSGFREFSFFRFSTDFFFCFFRFSATFLGLFRLSAIYLTSPHTIMSH